MVDLQLTIDRDFYKEEVRCDFLVSEKRKKIWAVELDLLNELLRVCRKYDINVCCFAGTILGAVRHQGFIPWDDDVDVCLLRSDYEKLLSVAEKEFKHPYFFQTAYNDRKFFFGYARLRNSETTGIISWNRSDEYNNGIYIDVFVMDGFIEDEDKFKSQYRSMIKINRQINCYYNAISNSWIKRIIKKCYGFWLRRFYSYEVLVKKYESVLMRYNGETSRVSLVTHGSDLTKKYWCYASDLTQTTEVPFEMLSVPIPIHYDSVLRNFYGDYMEFPPKEERGAWHENIIEFDPDIAYKEYFKKH